MATTDANCAVGKWNGAAYVNVGLLHVAMTMVHARVREVSRPPLAGYYYLLEPVSYYLSCLLYAGYFIIAGESAISGGLTKA